ncbi:hypothetical protein KBB27_03540 [Patescibacteria group bacterium]|nr:hypothetical protein [Patescibacteria group bacterium]
MEPCAWYERCVRWRNFGTYERAIRHIQRKRLKKLDEEFPPWWAIKEGDGSPLKPILSGMGMMILAWTLLYLAGVLNSSIPTIMLLIAAGISVYALIGFCWRMKRPHLAHLTEEDKDRARAEVTNIDAGLRREVISELMDAYGGQPSIEETMYRTSPELTGVRISLALNAAQTNVFKRVACEPDEKCGLCHRCYHGLLTILQTSEEARRASASR